MSADRPSETSRDEPEHYGDAVSHGREGFKAQLADRPSGLIRQAETRDRADCYEALRAADQIRSRLARADRGADTGGQSSAWDDMPTADHSSLRRTRCVCRPNAPRTSLTGTAGAGGTATGRAGPRRLSFLPTGTISGSSVRSWMWPVSPMPGRYCRLTTGGESGESVTA